MNPIYWRPGDPGFYIRFESDTIYLGVAIPEIGLWQIDGRRRYVYYVNVIPKLS